MKVWQPLGDWTLVTCLSVNKGYPLVLWVIPQRLPWWESRVEADDSLSGCFQQLSPGWVTQGLMWTPRMSLE